MSTATRRPLVATARGIRDVGRGKSGPHRRLRRHLADIVAATVVMDAIGTMLVYLFEHDAAETQITNVGDAAFWTTAQLLTVSSQMSAPLTTGGRIVDVVLMAYAITVVTALAGSFGAFFFHTRDASGS
jgi:hypothetical protein